MLFLPSLLPLTVILVALGHACLADSLNASLGHEPRDLLAPRKLPDADGNKYRFKFGGPTLKGDTLFGVGIGSWLVLESFITPSIFDQSGKDGKAVYDEWTLVDALGAQKATQILRDHHDKWITEDDFRLMKEYGLNAARIPIGYWAFDVQPGESYLKLDQWAMLLRACGWAQKHGIKVIVDLHGAPGSQNGYDHSGHRGALNWDKQQSNIDRTLAIIRTMATEFSQAKWADTIIALELLNEPKGVDMAKLKKFYQDAYHEIRSRGNLAVVLSDSFMGVGNWNDTLPYPQYEGVLIDPHIYFLFTAADLKLDPKVRAYRMCSHVAQFKQINSEHHWIMTGEWSPASTDCAININGRQAGSRYDGSYKGGGNNNGAVQNANIGSCAPWRGSASKWSQAQKDDLARWWETGMDAYYSGAGGFFWAWKTEDGTAEDFSYVAGVKNGWIPKNPRARPHGFHCPGVKEEGAINLSNGSSDGGTTGKSQASMAKRGVGGIAVRSSYVPCSIFGSTLIVVGLIVLFM